MSRDDIIRLAQSPKSWEFLPVVAQALRVAPADEVLRLLGAAHLARVGLPELSLEQFNLLSAPVRATPDAQRIAEAARALKPALLEPEYVQRTCEANARALTRRGVSVAVPLARWWDRAREHDWYRAADGNVIRRPRASVDPLTWRHLDDPKGQAAALIARHFASPEEYPRPLVLEGLDPPFLFQALAAALPRRASGHWPKLVLLQTDPLEFLDGLAQVDLRTELAQERTAVFIGPDASERYGRWMRQHLDRVVVGPALILPTLQTLASPPVGEEIARTERRQAEVMTQLQTQVRSHYAKCDRAWWQERFRAARNQSAEPLRVLIPTCRYSTYIRHAAADLAAAFERSGCRAEVLIEADDASRLSSLAYLDRLANFQPDLIVLINHTRASLGADLLAPNIPVATWIQDAMPHLFTDATGSAMGELDFILGHLHTSLFSRHGYPRERAAPLPVTADAAKFHTGPIDPGLARDLACDVACVTHHSETPQAMHERLVGELRRTGSDGQVIRVVEALYPRLAPLIAKAHHLPHHTLLREAILEASREALSQEPIPALADQIFRHYALPLADRIFRHQALHWAAGICVRHGWKFHLYGRGWSNHPSLAPFAQGELEHGDMLRAAYQSAKVNLHLCASTIMHQRVLECFLSGGLAAPRLFADALADLRCRALIDALRSAAPHTVDAKGKHFAFTDTPLGLQYAAAAQRLGITDHRLNMLLTPKREQELAFMSDDDRRLNDPSWLLGDLAEIGFFDEPSLERLISRARTRPAWRTNVIDGVRTRILDHLTTDAAVHTLLNLVHDGLTGAPARQLWIETAA